jgi:hypothetical protein
MLNFVEAFKSNNSIVSNHSSRDEGTLGFRDQPIKEWAQPVDEALRDDFVHHITQADWAEISQLLGVSSLGYKDDDRVIYPLWHDTFHKEILNSRDNLLFKQRPISLEETSRQTIRPRSFDGSDLEKGITNLIVSELSTELIVDIIRDRNLNLIQEVIRHDSCVLSVQLLEEVGGHFLNLFLLFHPLAIAISQLGNPILLLSPCSFLVEITSVAISFFKPGHTGPLSPHHFLSKQDFIKFW